MDFIRPIMRYLTVEKPPAVPLLALRVICNMFAHNEGTGFFIILARFLRITIGRND